MDRTRVRRPRRPRAVVLAALLAVLTALTACTADPAARDRPDAAPATSAPAPEHASGNSFPPPLPAPTDDPASERSAVERATAAVTAFARPGIDPGTWWADLAPLLSPTALEAYVGTDPAEVPARAVTGAAWPGESASSYLATVFVPTDAGEYAVLLVREGGGAPWLVERISQVRPESAGDQQGAAAGTGP